MIKSAVTLALDAVNPDKVPSAFVQGDTIGNTPDFDANMAVLSTDVLFMKMVDRRYRLGGAPIAVPVTETERIPTWDEVATVQTISRRLEDYVPMVDAGRRLGAIEALRDRLVGGGRRFFEDGHRRLAGAGIDIRDPARLLLVLKRLGAHRCEELFGAGEPDPEFPRGRRPILRDRPGEAARWQQRERLLAELRGRARSEAIRGMKVLVSSTDVHEFAEFLLVSTLEAVGSRRDRLRHQPRPRGHRQGGDRDRCRRGRDHHPQWRRPFLRTKLLMSELERRRDRRDARLHGRRAERGRRRLGDPDRRPRRPQRGPAFRPRRRSTGLIDALIERPA